MADPFTILGAAALNYYGKASKSPRSSANFTRQPKMLLNQFARLIIQNPSLQTASVASILSTCLRSAEEFHGTLKKISVTTMDRQVKKIQKALTAAMKEKKILALFENLEREKSSLALCI
jgi:hypothetical protein